MRVTTKKEVHSSCIEKSFYTELDVCVHEVKGNERVADLCFSVCDFSNWVEDGVVNIVGSVSLRGLYMLSVFPFGIL